jgi:hypothetical protein
VQVASVEIQGDSIVALGSMAQLHATLLGPQGDSLAERAVAWSSSDSSVVRVSPTGELQPVSRGAALVSARSEGQTAELRVHVAPAGYAGRWTGISAGLQHACALTPSGAMYCWGRGNAGQLGTGGTDSSSVPVRVVSADSFTQVSASNYATCGVGDGGAAWCWGGVFPGRAVVLRFAMLPTRFAPGQSFASVDAGAVNNTGCGVLTDRALYCWKYLAETPGYGGVEGRKEGRYRAVMGGPVCGATAADSIVCWNERTGESSSFAKPGPPATGLSGDHGGHFFCTWTDGGPGYCTTYVEPQTDGALDYEGLTRLPGDLSFVRVAAGVDSVCGLDTSGRAYCAQGAFTEPGAFQPVGGGLRFTQIAVGDRFMCGLTAQGAIFCWGADKYGQLGNGRFDGQGSDQPVLVQAPTE